LPWSEFKAKLNKSFTPHNQILKDGQELLSLHQFNGLGAMGRYVQTFMSLLSLIELSTNIPLSSKGVGGHFGMWQGKVCEKLHGLHLGWH
jgi:hypothetical protein